ncbi:MAG TPA: phosphocholine cytidylyltransferase family protein [Vicinamibacterales bacterium]|nr:phosphocholine cytidylyltransferase family protein [Vicinamibacterales bacterium]
MQGVILAAGRGSRLNGATANMPKCLVRLGGSSLLERQIDALRACGVDDIAAVVGCEAEAVRRHCGPGIRFVENAAFATTNSLYSLWLARHLLTDAFVVMNCDVVFHPRLLDDLLTARYEDALLMAYRDDSDPPFGDEEMKIKVRRGCVVDISKQMDPAEADGENLGIVKFGRDGARALVPILDRIVKAGGTREWAPRAFLEFARVRPLHAIGTRGLPWTEVDFPEDYQRALDEILPAIAADLADAPDAAEYDQPVAATGTESRA